MGAAGSGVTEFVGRPTPNPALQNSTVQFRVAKPGFVELSVFDPNDRRVRTLHAGVMTPGVYSVEWNGRTDHFSDASAGMYVFVLVTPDGMRSQRVALVR
jgi:hypothetical protein